MKRLHMAAAAVVAAASLCITVLPAQAGAASVALKATRLGAGAATTVTLITGDRVKVSTDAGGHRAVAVEPADIPGRHVVFSAWTGPGGDVRVVPSDMAPLLGSVLDERLFDVGELMREGYDDAHASSLPLIVQHASGARAAALSGAWVLTGRELSSIHATAVGEVRSKAAAGLGAALAKAGHAALAGHKAAGTLGGALAGVRHVWLDGKVKAAGLDWNLEKINAPQAWSTGATGKGVKVAVIDTGIDTTHPDLAGHVDASVNFSDAADTGDHVGHGTHVAGTIAGTGAASGGARKGAAFGATLLNVKVLDDDGQGMDSSVIAGMEWAAQHGAKVANLSLGGEPTDGTDPDSLALDQLTAQYGTLFVVAAGNNGKPHTIATPGAADDALTVAATDRDDAVARFSSRGPRIDGAFKPDISAPGDGIVEDRAAGTSLGSPVDQYYTTLSGTSMATPHVAGAAALLAQEHPDYTPAQLKSVLQSSSHTLGGPAPGVVFGSDQGAGRLDAAAALDQQVVPDRATFDFGRLLCDNTSAMTRQVTLTNTGKADASFDLSSQLTALSNLQAAPEGMVKLSAEHLTVPAGGSKTLTLTLDPSQTLEGEYSGQVVATPTGGGAPLHLAIGFEKSDLCALHLSALGLDGTPAIAYGPVLDLDTDRHTGVSMAESGTTMLLPKGKHLAFALSVEQMQPDGRLAAAVMNVPEITVTPGKDVVLDMRKTSPVTADIPSRHVATATTYVNADRTSADGAGHIAFFDMATDASTDIALYAGQTADPVVHGTLDTQQYVRLVDAAHATDPAHASQVYDLAWTGHSFPADMHHVLTDRDVEKLARVDAEYRNLNYPQQSRGDFEGRLPSANGKPLFFLWPPHQQIALPIKRTEYVSPHLDWQRWYFHNSSSNWATTQLMSISAQHYRTGERTHEDQLAGPFTTVGTGRLDAHVLEMLAWDSTDTAGNSLWNDNPAGTEPGWGNETRAWQDGRLVADWHDYQGGFDLPAPSVPTTWKVQRDITTPGKLTSGNDTHTVWTFKTRPVTDGAVSLPLLDLDYRIPLDENNQARPGHALPLTVAAHRLAGAQPSRITSLEVTYSTDGGKTWHKPNGAMEDGRYQGVLPGSALAAGQMVALHVTARDAEGGTIDQTLNEAILTAR
ncbi:S8 family serine peptidase [Streptomyces sp. NPDC005731]|uniref:S8 family peptidase n=1 Tax=unclassified Streptomyces TaxID=2593676 RepID=UPI0033F2722A